MFVVSGADLSARQLHDLLAIRAQIFVVEQACVYLDIDGRDLDPTTEHVWFADEVGVTANLRILRDTDTPRIGRVLTRPDRRGGGLASQLLKATLEHLGPVTTVLDAQSHLQHLYESLGYDVDGAEFIEDGIPHVPMIRKAEQ